MMKTLLIVSGDETVAKILDDIIKDFYRVTIFSDLKSSLDYIYNYMPDTIIINTSLNDYKTIELLNELKDDPVFGQIPVIIILPEKNIAPIWHHIHADDFLWITCLKIDLLVRISLCMRRVERMTEINPLTRLPGNIAINKQLQKRIDTDELFALGYADIDYFKPFNDKYGFSRGDEVLKMLGDIILKSVKKVQPHNSFVGHIGGDDFIFIMDIDAIEEASSEIVSAFDSKIFAFYDEDDRLNGYIESVDREGINRRYPVMSLSIGITHTRFRKFSHYSEMAEVASEMKKYAKSCQGSCYRVDKRGYSSV